MPTLALLRVNIELEQGYLFYMGQIYQVPLPRLSYVHLPSPSQYVLDLVYMNLVSIKASGLGSLIKNYSSPWPGLGSHIYT